MIGAKLGFLVIICLYIAGIYFTIANTLKECSVSNRPGVIAAFISIILIIFMITIGFIIDCSTI
jgi:hypothetical protein